jgi:phosphatidylserine synthase
MRWFKIIDFWMNIILLVLSVVFICLDIDKFNRDDFEYCLLIIALVFGYTQSFSMIVHISFWKKWRFTTTRISYMLLAILVLFYSNFKIVNEWYSIHIYLLTAMVIFYTCLCGFEVFTKVKRPLDLLK